MSNSTFKPRQFGFGAFLAASALAGAAGQAGVRAVQDATAGNAYRSSRQLVAGRLRRMRAEAREASIDLSLARLESALRLRYIERNGIGSAGRASR